MVLSLALEEAYANVDVTGDYLDTLEFDHVTFEAPLRFVNGTPVKGLYETVVLPVPGNANAVFTVVPFSFTRPGYEEGGSTKATLSIDNVSSVLQQALRASIASDRPFELVYRTYSTIDKNNPEIYNGLRMGSVSVNVISASGDLYYEEVELKAFPRETYNLTDFPALYGQ